MTSKILIELNSVIKCPKCSTEFALVEGLALKTIDQYESDLEKVIREREDEITEKVTKQAEDRAASEIKGKLGLLEQQLKDRGTPVGFVLAFHTFRKTLVPRWG
ncbi:MAG: hypothetical protein RQ767_02475, partial [Thermovirgaceae bacterium]|nr:hypothetical protein [Thermovirgaceae bacterium]